MRGSSTDTAGSKRSTPPPQSPLLPRAPRNRRTSALACVVRYDALCRSLSNFEIELNREPLKHKMYTLQQQFEQQRQAQLPLPSAPTPLDGVAQYRSSHSRSGHLACTFRLAAQERAVRGVGWKAAVRSRGAPPQYCQVPRPIGIV